MRSVYRHLVDLIDEFRRGYNYGVLIQHALFRIIVVTLVASGMVAKLYFNEILLARVR